MSDLTSKKLMELFLNCPNFVRSICISDKQLKILNLINENPGECMRAKELSAIESLTIQNASTQLNKLFEIGYLTRKELKSKTGGKEFLYSTVIGGDIVY